MQPHKLLTSISCIRIETDREIGTAAVVSLTRIVIGTDTTEIGMKEVETDREIGTVAVVSLTRIVIGTDTTEIGMKEIVVGIEIAANRRQDSAKFWLMDKETFLMREDETVIPGV